MKFTFVDLFAGIGGFHEAAKHVGGHCVFASEIDKHAAKTYESNHGIKPHGDITKIDAKDIPDHDILFAGFPCQAFSVAGKRLGFEDTRGTLFFEVARIMKEKQPPIVVLENVKGLKSHDKGKTLSIILDTIKSLSYTVYYQVLNAKTFGVPQNRERIFIVCFRENRLFTFPIPTKTTTRLGDILLDEVPDKYYLTDKALQSAQAHKERHAAKGNGFGYKIADANTPHSMAITSHYSKGGSEIMIWHTNMSGNISKKDFSCALRANASANYLTVNGIRRLTPRECARLQGFPDSFQFPVSDSQAYKQIGNAVCVPVVKAILQMLFQ